jgi:hypothetical protein
MIDSRTKRITRPKGLLSLFEVMISSFPTIQDMKLEDVQSPTSTPEQPQSRSDCLLNRD